ncbi:MAG: recombinase family protein [Acidobacteriales bacterium]|nr:recombinase family protein [Terriglobales bacterium]
MKAYGYVRVSGRGQVEGDGFPRQIAAIKKYAAEHNIHVIKVFQEEAVCGATEWANRPAWLEMLAALNGCRTIIIEKLDRVARDLMVQEHIIADLRQRGIELVSVHEPDLCRDDPTRNLLRQIMGAIAEYDRCMVVLRLRGARQRMKAQTGRCEGRKPYGFRPGEAEVIRRMKELRAAGLGYDRIAETLNTEGLKPRAGARWWGRGVNNALKGVSL